MKEYDMLRELFSHAETSSQSLFNFYLTLISSLVGALVLLRQFGAPSGQNSLQLQIMTSLILFFAAGIGAVYITSLISRYSNMARYAYGIDELRRLLLTQFDVQVPPVYREFLSTPPSPRPTARPSLFWLLPAGPFQFFMTVFNSLSLAGGVWFLLAAGGVTGTRFGSSALVILIVFVLAFAVYNYYSHMLLYAQVARFNVRVDTHREGRPWWPGRRQRES